MAYVQNAKHNANVYGSSTVFYDPNANGLGTEVGRENRMTRFRFGGQIPSASGAAETGAKSLTSLLGLSHAHQT